MTQTSLILIGLAVSCGRSQTPALQPRDAKSCTPDAYLLSLPSEGGFVLNSEQRDSAGIASWLRDVLPRRTGTGRNVNIRLANERSRDVPWLVAAIRDAGGEAFEFDPKCSIQIPSTSRPD